MELGWVHLLGYLSWNNRTWAWRTRSPCSRFLVKNFFTKSKGQLLMLRLQVLGNLIPWLKLNTESKQPNSLTWIFRVQEANNASHTSNLTISWSCRNGEHSLPCFGHHHQGAGLPTPTEESHSWPPPTTILILCHGQASNNQEAEAHCCILSTDPSHSSGILLCISSLADKANTRRSLAQMSSLWLHEAMIYWRCHWKPSYGYSQTALLLRKAAQRAQGSRGSKTRLPTLPTIKAAIVSSGFSPWNPLIGYVGMVQSCLMGGLDQTLGSIPLLRGWSDTGTGFLERWSMPQACQCWRGIWTMPLTTCFDFWSALQLSGSWTRWSL